MSRKKSASGDVYIEFITMGHMVKVSAIDAVSGEEVSFAGPVNTSRSELERVAIAKLRYVQNKNKSSS